MYYLLALALFPDHSYRSVWHQLTAALGGMPLPSVSQAALRHLRRHITAAPPRQHSSATWTSVDETDPAEPSTSTNMPHDQARWPFGTRNPSAAWRER